MKKFLGLALIVSMIIGMITVPVFAYDGTSYTWSFDSAATKDIPDGDGSIGGTNGTDYDFVGRTGETDTNKVFEFKTGSALLDTGHQYWESDDKSVNGTSVLSFDFMIPSDCTTTYTTFVYVRFDNTLEGNDTEVNRLISFRAQDTDAASSDKSWDTFAVMASNGNDKESGNDPRYYAPIGDVEADKWHNIKIVFDPANTSAKWILTKDCDDTKSENIFVYEGGIYSGKEKRIENVSKIKRLKFNIQNSGMHMYVDKMSFKELESDIIMTASPIDGSANAPVTPTIDLTFNRAVTPVGDFTVNGESVKFSASNENKTFSYTVSDAFGYSENVIVKGLVKDVEGIIYVVDHSFTTMQKTGISTVNDDRTSFSYTFDTDSGKGYDGNSTNAPLQYVVENEDTVLKMPKNGTWRMWAWDKAKNYINGDIAVSFDVKLNRREPKDESLNVEFLQFAYDITSDGKPDSEHYSSSTNHICLMHRIDGTWDIGFKIVNSLGNRDYKYLYTGLENNTWQTLSLVFYPTEAAYDVILPDRIERFYVDCDESGNINERKSASGKTYDIRLKSNRDDTDLYFDDFTVKQHIAMDGAHFADGNGNAMTDNAGSAITNSAANGIYYKADIINGSSLPRKITLALCEYNNGELEQLELKPLTIPANNKLSVNEGFKSVKVGSTVKAFFLNSDDISPFKTDALKLLEISINETRTN